MSFSFIRDYSVCYKVYKTITCSLLKLKYKMAMIYTLLNTYHDSVMLATY